jgi:hypothetical protein
MYKIIWRSGILSARRDALALRQAQTPAATTPAIQSSRRRGKQPVQPREERFVSFQHERRSFNAS